MFVISFKKTAAGPHGSTHWTTWLKHSESQKSSTESHTNQAQRVNSIKHTSSYTFLYGPFYYKRDVIYITFVRDTYPSRALGVTTLTFAEEDKQCIRTAQNFKLSAEKPLKRALEFLWNCCSYTFHGTWCWNCCNSTVLARGVEISSTVLSMWCWN
jgi:hypothetical protein